MTLYGSNFLNMLRNFRICWLGGRFGGGKTALAVRMSMEFLERGWVEHAVGNFPCVTFTDLHRIDECRDTFIVLDEAGVWLSDKEFDSITAFLRKRNLYVVLSSVLPVQLRARTLNIQRIFNGHTVGLNFWLYGGVLDYMRVKEKLSLTWTNPREIFGLYDTTYVTADDAGIVEWVLDAFKQQQAMEAANPPLWKKYQVLRNNAKAHPAGAGKIVDALSWKGIQGVDESRRNAEEIALAAEKIEAALPVLAKAGRRRRR